MSGPSDKAVEAARQAFDAPRMRVTNPKHRAQSDAEYAVHAAHDPALGLVRSVCLRDVVEALREYAKESRHPAGVYAGIQAAADFIEGEFGGTDA